MKKQRLVLVLLSAAALAATRTVTFSVSGWTCGACAASTRIALKKLDGVLEVKTDLEKAEAVVTYDEARVTPAKMAESIGKLGYRASVKGSPAEKALPRSAGPNPSVAGKELGQNASPFPASSIRRALSPQRVSVFETPLGCWAVEGLGCGSLSKPVLAALEEDTRIAEAWLNRAGTLLAVVWEESAAAAPWVETVEEVFEERGLAARPLEGPEREKVLTDFLGGPEWYRGTEVDRVSEEEARVVAARLVRRIEKGGTLAPERAASLRKGLTEIFTRHFVGRGGDRSIETELRELASDSLDDREIGRFQKALTQGIRALPGESR
jgi:copper chaperone CopZ